MGRPHVPPGLGILAFAALAAVAAVAGCSSSSSTAAPAPTPGPPVAAPVALTFLGTGSALAQSVTLSETFYAGTFAASSTNCTGIATVSSGASSGAFKVTPVAAGACTFTFTDAQQRTIALPVSVTVTLGGGQ